jgi:cystathionine gamma-synthase
VAVTDIAAVAALARGAGARCVCDNTAATSVLQRPFAHGADLVVYATTKYLGGHGDVTGGAVIARRSDPFFERIRAIQGSGGAVPSPFDCWLVRRGIRTLPWRMRAHCDTALRVATFLASHPRVEAVHYPGLGTHPQHEVARRQMTGFGGMLSVQVRGGRDAAFEVERKVRVFTCATSFGGTESLLEHRASVEGAATRSPESLLRLSIGLEHPDDLIEDLDQALGR